jgi:hypothetical protein
MGLGEGSSGAMVGGRLRGVKVGCGDWRDVARSGQIGHGDGLAQAATIADCRLPHMAFPCDLAALPMRMAPFQVVVLDQELIGQVVGASSLASLLPVTPHSMLVSRRYVAWR